MLVMARFAPPMTVYLDNSALGRLSDPAADVPIGATALRHLLVDAAAVERLVEAVRSGRLVLLSSDALAFEVRRAPPRVQRVSWNVLQLATIVVPVEPTRPQARLLQAAGFEALDALHIAAAYVGGADYAVSCDEAHWLRRAGRIGALLGPGPAIVSPTACVAREGLGS